MSKPQEHNSWTPSMACEIQMFPSACFLTNVVALKPNLRWGLLIRSLSPLSKQDLEIKFLPTNYAQKQFVKIRARNTVPLTLTHLLYLELN